MVADKEADRVLLVFINFAVFADHWVDQGPFEVKQSGVLENYRIADFNRLEFAIVGNGNIGADLAIFD